MSWNDTNRQEDEQVRPLPPYTKVTAVQDFHAQHPHDLPFSRGDRLTTLEPCNVIFWYLAEDAHGKRGVIPINFVKVDGSGGGNKVWSKPPPPLPPHPSFSSSTGHLNTAVTPDQRQRRLSPQTIPRSSIHPLVHRTSSVEALDSSHTPPKPRLPSPPMTSSITSPATSLITSSTPPPPPDRTTPPAIPPRHAPPIPFRDPTGGRQNIPRSPEVTPGGLSPGYNRPNSKPPAPLPPSPKPHLPGKKPAPPPLQPKPGTKKRVPQHSNGPLSSPWQQTFGKATPPGATPTKRPSYENKEPLTLKFGPLSRPKPPGPPIDIDNRPPAPLPPEAFLPGSAGASAGLSPGPKGKYTTSHEFINKSGWFQPSVEGVVCRKAVIQLPVFQTMSTGIYLFKHRFRGNLQYVGKSHNLYKGLIQMFHQLFERPDSQLNPMELQLKYRNPDAEEWYVRLVAVQNPEKLDLEHCKMIARIRSVQPEGLNQKLEFSSREVWYDFAAWYKDHCSKLKAKERASSSTENSPMPKRRT